MLNAAFSLYELQVFSEDVSDDSGVTHDIPAVVGIQNLHGAAVGDGCENLSRGGRRTAQIQRPGYGLHPRAARLTGGEEGQTEIFRHREGKCPCDGVQIVFDPPTGSVMTEYTNQLKEEEWRLTIAAEELRKSGSNG